MGPGVQPGVTTAHQLNVQLAAAEVFLVDVGNFQFAPRGRLDVLGDVNHVVVVEVETGDRVVALRVGRLLLNRQGVHLVVKFDDPKALGIVDVVAAWRRLEPAVIGRHRSRCYRRGSGPPSHPR